MGQSQISRAADLDPVFTEIAKALYGDTVDPRELWDLSKMADSSEVHAPGGDGAKKKAGLAAGLVAGVGIEAIAAKDTIPATRAALRAVTPAVRAAGSLGAKAAALKPLGRPGVKTALQAGNFAVGLGAARELAKKPPRTGVQKALRPTGGQAAPETRDLIRRISRRNALALATSTGAAAGGALGYKIARIAPRQRPPRPPGATQPVGKSVTWTGEISKVDADRRQVFGWCSITELDGEKVIDLQGDHITIEEIEKSAYHYVINSRKGGDMHRRVRGDGLSKADQPLHTSDLIESFVVTPEKLERMGLSKAAAETVPIGWWVGFKVNDDTQWQKVKNGERLGFSIHGSGTRRPLEDVSKGFGHLAAVRDSHAALSAVYVKPVRTHAEFTHAQQAHHANLRAAFHAGHSPAEISDAAGHKGVGPQAWSNAHHVRYAVGQEAWEARGYRFGRPVSKALRPLTSGGHQSSTRKEMAA